MFAPPPVTRYSPVAASYVAEPGLGLSPTSVCPSKMPIGVDCARTKMLEQIRTSKESWRKTLVLFMIFDESSNIDVRSCPGKSLQLNILAVNPHLVRRSRSIHLSRASRAERARNIATRTAEELSLCALCLCGE